MNKENNNELLLRGRLEDVHFADVLRSLFQRNETGVLEVKRPGVQKSIYFDDGRVVFAKSTDPDEGLGALLIRQGKVTFRQWEDSKDKVGPGMRLGTVLVLQGYITSEDLYRGVIDQVQEILFRIFEWSEGEFVFHPGPLPGHEVITLNLSTPDLIFEGIDRVWRWSLVRKTVISLDAVFRKQAGWMTIAKRMTVTPERKFLIDLLDRPRTLEEILLSSSESSFQTCKLLWALLSAGIAEQILTAPEIAEPTLSLRAPSLESAAESTSPMLAKLVPSAGPAEESPITVEMRKREVEVSKSEEREPSPQTEGIPAAGMVIASDMPTIPVPPPEATTAQTVEAPLPSPGVELSFADLAELTDLVANAAPSPEHSVREEWEGNVEANVKNFNEKHRYVFEMLRLELGSEMLGFLSKIIRKSSARFPLVFDGVQINEFGEFNENSLIGNIEGNLAETYGEAFDFLLQEERVLMGTLLKKKERKRLK